MSRQRIVTQVRIPLPRTRWHPGMSPPERLFWLRRRPTEPDSAVADEPTRSRWLPAFTAVETAETLPWLRRGPGQPVEDAELVRPQRWNPGTYSPREPIPWLRQQQAFPADAEVEPVARKWNPGTFAPTEPVPWLQARREDTGEVPAELIARRWNPATVPAPTPAVETLGWWQRRYVQDEPAPEVRRSAALPWLSPQFVPDVIPPRAVTILGRDTTSPVALGQDRTSDAILGQDKTAQSIRGDA